MFVAVSSFSQRLISLLMLTVFLFFEGVSGEVTLRLSAIMKANKCPQAQHKQKGANARQSNPRPLPPFLVILPRGVYGACFSNDLWISNRFLSKKYNKYLHIARSKRIHDFPKCSLILRECMMSESEFELASPIPFFVSFRPLTLCIFGKKRSLI